MLELCFVVAPGQDPLVIDVARALQEELGALGVNAQLTVGDFPEARAGRVYVLVSPLEHAEARGEPLPARLLSRTVFVGTEPPGSRRFEASLRLAGLGGAVVDVNRAGVRELRRHGVAAEHLPLGYSSAWDRFDPGRERDVDLAFMTGPCVSFSDRRDRIVACWAEWLWRHRVELVIPDNLVAASAASWATSEGKRALLARTKILLNIHPTPEPAFSWTRALDAIHSGAVVVTEHATDYDPLAPGHHFLCGAPGQLPLVAAELLEDPERRREMARAAHELIRRELPMRAAAERLVAVAEPLGSRPARRGTRARLAISSGYAAVEPSLDVAVDPLRKRLKAPARRARRARKRRALEAIERERRAARLGATGNGAGDGGIEVAHESGPRAAGAAPRVSVIVPVFNEEYRVVGALDSVGRSRLREFELVVVDDGSADGTLDLVREWMEDHDSVPAVLARHPTNRGLPASRNTAIGLARGEEVLPLDADNELYPHCLERLTGALDSDPAAPFAYGVLQAFDGAGPRGVIGYFDWEPERLRRWNYIDALALIRKRALREVGGFTTDIRLYGWEDYDLWCAFAARRMRPVHVREIVARYRRSADSMISVTNLSLQDAYAALAERHPALFRSRVGKR